MGPTERFTFSDGESKLSAWLEQNARVAWSLADRPWEFEEALISAVSLPLNLEANAQHPYRPLLEAARAEARMHARALPVCPR